MLFLVFFVLLVGNNYSMNIFNLFKGLLITPTNFYIRGEKLISYILKHPSQLYQMCAFTVEHQRYCRFLVFTIVQINIQHLFTHINT